MACFFKHESLFAFTIYLAYLVLALSARNIKFKELHCELLGESLADITPCYFKPTSRDSILLQINATLKKDVFNAKGHGKLMQRLNGWHPFLYDLTMDMCDFFARPKRYFLAHLAYSFVKNLTNINHKCPYKNGENLFFKYNGNVQAGLWNKLYTLAPVDSGTYGIFGEIFINDKLVATGHATFVVFD